MLIFLPASSVWNPSQNKQISVAIFNDLLSVNFIIVLFSWVGRWVLSYPQILQEFKVSSRNGGISNYQLNHLNILNISNERYKFLPPIIFFLQRCTRCCRQARTSEMLSEDGETRGITRGILTAYNKILFSLSSLGYNILLLKEKDTKVPKGQFIINFKQWKVLENLV